MFFFTFSFTHFLILSLSNNLSYRLTPFLVSHSVTQHCEAYAVTLLLIDYVFLIFVFFIPHFLFGGASAPSVFEVSTPLQLLTRSSQSYVVLW